MEDEKTTPFRSLTTSRERAIDETQPTELISEIAKNMRHQHHITNMTLILNRIASRLGWIPKVLGHDVGWLGRAGHDTRISRVHPLMMGKRRP